MKIGIQTYGENGAHLFTNDSPELEYVGLSSYSMYQLNGIVLSDGLYNLKITPRDKIYTTLIGETVRGDAKYLKYNKETGGFSEVTIDKNKIKNLIEWHEFFNENPRYTSKPTGGYTIEEASRHLIDISNSLSGCLTFLVSGEIKIDYTAPENNAGCEKDIITNINLHFTKRNDDDNNEIVQKFHAMAGIPNTPAGTAYGWTGTQKATSDNHPGILAPVQDGGEKNVNNMVSAPIAKSYCSNTATWEFGTQQILVRLLTNVAAVAETQLDAETFDNISFEELSNPGSAFYLSNYTTGWASPIYPQNKNPNLAMPAFTTKSCDDKNTKEKIIVVNRSTRPYAIGELAKAARICGEWILSPLSEAKAQVFTPVVNKWRFQKFIVDSDSYFKSYKYFESLDDYDGSLSTEETKYAANVSPTTYESSMTKLYFIDMSTSSSFPTLNGLNDKVKIAKANLNAAVPLETIRNWTDEKWAEYTIPVKATQIEQGSIIVPSDRYWQSTVADQMGFWTGGVNNFNIIGRTNISVNNDVGEEDKANWAYKFNHFWGPIFNGGYDASKIGAINDGQVKFKVYRNNSQYFSNSALNGDGSNVEINDFGPARNIQYDPNRYMFSQVGDGSWSQFPAEMALLGGPNAKNGGPQECFDVIKTRIGPSIAKNDKDAYKLITEAMSYDLSGIPQRWDWLYIDNESSDDYLVSDLYDLRPQGLTLTFMPLSAEMVGSSDKFSDDLGPVKQGTERELDPSISILRKLYRTARGFNKGDALWGHAEDGAGYKSRFPFLAEDYWITAIGQSILPHVWGNKFFTREKQEDFDSFREMKSFYGGKVVRGNDIIPYDYAVRQTSSHANGNPVIWFASNTNDDDSTQRIRPGKNDTGISNADCVGVICAKVSLSWNQESIPITVSERFGLEQLGYTLNVGARDFAFSVTPQGGFYAGPVEGESRRVNTPNWGSTVDNAEGLYSFATNALFARVFTQWPEKQTLFDGRYFGVLHFNPIAISDGDAVETEIKSFGVTFNGTWSPAVSITNSYRTSTLPDYARSVDKITSAVDFRVPTYADPKGGKDNSIVEAGSIVDRCGVGNKVLRPLSEWRVNPVRRGKMFAIYGSKRSFRYFKRVIGVSKDLAHWKYAYAVDSNGNTLKGTGADDGKGKNYSVGDIIGISGGGGIGAKIEITSVVSGGSVSTFKVIDQGQGYLPVNFKDTSWDSPENRKSDPLTVLTANNIKVKNPKATGLKLGPIVGEVYDRLEEDVGPSQVSTMTRLSSPSAGGEEGIIEKTTKRSIVLSKDVPSSKYDVFFHFHNDIAHTLSAWREWQRENSSGLAQYCTITIG
jgi:hypothetical protein